MSRYAPPLRMKLIASALTLVVPDTPLFFRAPAGTESMTTTAPSSPNPAGPWMCAAVAPDGRLANDPLTLTLPALSLNETITVAVPGLLFGGVACAPVSSIVKVFCGHTATGLNAHVVSCALQQ